LFCKRAINFAVGIYHLIGSEMLYIPFVRGATHGQFRLLQDGRHGSSNLHNIDTTVRPHHWE